MSNLKANRKPTTEVVTSTGRPMTPAEALILNFCEQFWHEEGRLPSPAEIVSAEFDRELFLTCVKLPSFNLALEQRGIRPFTMLDANGNPPVGLSATQLMVINVMLDTADTRSKTKKLGDLGVSSQTWTAWTKDTVFQRHLSARAERQLGTALPDVHNGLVHAASNGDVSAIKTYYEITGRWSPAQTKGVDVQLVIVKVLELIQRFVPETAVQELIARELLKLTEPVAAQLDGKPILAPIFNELGAVETPVGFTEKQVVDVNAIVQEVAVKRFETPTPVVDF